jgi:hypothetical protein
MAKIPLSNREYELLVDNYHCEDKKGYVWWMKICNLVDEVHTTKGLETNPMFKKTPFKKQKSLVASKMSNYEIQ